MPSYVMAYAYTDFLQYAGPVQSALRDAFGWTRQDYWFPDVRTLPGAAAMFVFTLYPYVFLLARTAFLERSPALVEAARTLGLDRRRAFWRVELPLARPAIAAGVALALMETLADYGTVAYFAVDTFTTGIYRAWFSLGDRTAAAQLACGAAAVRGRRGRARARVARRGDAPSTARAARRPRIASPTPLTGMRGGARDDGLRDSARGRASSCPVLLLLRLLLGEADVAFTSRYLAWSYNSLRVALLAAVLAVALATLDGLRATPRTRRGDARGQPRAEPRLCGAGHRARGRRAAAARRRRQRDRGDGGARRPGVRPVCCSPGRSSR